MCGILVQYSFNPSYPLDRARFERALAAMTRRGPDDCGVHEGAGVLIGMRRLSIIDIKGGRQPIANESGNIRVVCNGEIYNFRQLRGQLENAGHHFTTATDSEVLVHRFEETVGQSERLGAQALDARLRSFLTGLSGMFAFALLDERSRTMIVARDRMGIKPLYRLQTPHFVAFASDIEPLRILAPDRLAPDPSLLSELLQVGYLLGRHSGYVGIERVLPAETWLVSPDGVRQLKYWGPADIASAGRSDSDQPLGETIAERLPSILPTVLDDQLVSDVSTGLFLSGGLDSTLIACAIKRELGRDIPCFTLAFNDQTHDESGVAREVARSLGLRHELIMMDEPDEELVEESLAAFTEPLADMSIIPTFFLSRQTAAHSKVVLAGDGGDELFGGYPTQFLTAMSPWLAPLRRLGWLVDKLPSRHEYLPLEMKLKAFFAGLDDDFVTSHFGWRRLFHNLDDVLTQQGHDQAEWRSILAEFFAEWDRFPSNEHAACAAWLDCMSYLPDTILHKTDRATMFHSQEARVPLLDHRLIDVALLSPVSERGSILDTKRVVRRLLRDRYQMPESVWRKPKQGFAPPLARWITGKLKPLFSEKLKERLAATGYFDPSVVDRLMAEHCAGRRDHSRRLWALYVVAAWLAKR